MLSTQNLNIADRPTHKLMERWAGPYKIMKIVSSNTIELELLPTMKIHPVVNVSCVKLWKAPMEGQNKPAPLPIEIEGEEEYEVEEVEEVEEVLDSRHGLTKYWV